MSRVNRSIISLKPETVKKYNIPDNWVCNLSTEHLENGNIISHSSPDYPIVVLKCCCVECMNLDMRLYKIGDPVQVHESFDLEYLIDNGTVGVYIRDC